jgi:pyrroloquinoline quinone (PQQ) biosynthesis protein C
MPNDYVNQLTGESDAFVEALDRAPLVGSVIRGMASPEQYVAFLIGTFQYVRWSGYLLAQTALGLRRAGRYPALVEAVNGKAAEEGPHDRLLLRDLAHLGQNVELIKGRSAPTAVQAYVSYSLARANDGSPAYLGAAYTLEYVSMRRAKVAARELRRHSTLPNIEQALSFLDTHGTADLHHVTELEELLNAIADPHARADILLSATVLRRLYPNFFELPIEGA